MSTDEPRHGTTQRFHRGCNCTACRAAIARYQKGLRARRYQGVTWQIPALGDQRRIQALMALGWTMPDIAKAAGWPHANYVRRILAGQKGKPCRFVHRKTHTSLGAAYAALSMRLGDGPQATRTRNLAARKGWAPPLAWDDIDNPAEHPKGVHTSRVLNKRAQVDPVVVERILAGEVLPTTPAEKKEALRRWLALGHSVNSLCERAGWHTGRYIPREDISA